MATPLKLPYAVVSRSDVGRLLRELDSLEAALKRKTAKKDEPMLPVSRLLDEIAEENKCNLLQAEDRGSLKAFLKTVYEGAPLLHFSFSVDPSPRFLSSLVAWLRQEIDPLVLLQLGLEPSLGAGCVLRTTNRNFDFSLRQHFAKQQKLLIGKIKEGL